MDNETKLIMLGTGGGRYATITQRRRTAGIRIMQEGVDFHLDPGPGALIYSINENLSPQKLNAVFVSHCHPDHYTDAEVLIEAMTHGTTSERNTLVAAKSVLNGSSTCEPSISKYHQKAVKKIIEAVPRMKFSVNNVDVSVTETRHTDPDAVGFRFQSSKFGDFAYTSDTEYFEGIDRYYRGTRLLILCVMRPTGKPWKGHMTTDDAVKIVEETRPEQAILTHLGMQMLQKGPQQEARRIQEKTKIPTVAAVDGMEVTLGEKIRFQTSKTQKKQNLSEFL